MRAPSGPIQVFGDDTFVVEFEETGIPLGFTLTTPLGGLRHGTFNAAIEFAEFDDGTLTQSTDLRVLIRAYRSRMG